MRRATLAATLLASTFGIASADVHKVLVLKADGNADAATKAKVDAEVQKLARAITGATVETGEVTFTDAAVAVGCSGGEAQCRDDVLGTLGVDEVIAITVAAMPSGDTRVLVDRIPKGTPIKNGTSTVPAGQPIEAKLEADIGPNFGVKAAEPPPAPTPPPSTGVVTPSFGEPGTATTTPTEPPSTAPIPNETPVGTPPTAEGASSSSSSRGPVIGFAVGGSLVVLSLIMWGEASSTQGDINNAPTKTTADFQNLQNLESKGDTYAALGNVFFVGGLVVAGVSGYFFWRDHRNHAQPSAMVTPTLFDHGAGIALTGAMP